MIASLVFPLIILTLAYVGAILGLIWILRRVGVAGRWAISLGSAGFGAVSGLLSAWIWPLDSSVYPNVWAVLLGDWLYNLSTTRWGDAWLLGVPQIYVVSGLLLYGGLGFLIQGLYLHRRARKAPAGQEAGP